MYGGRSYRGYSSRPSSSPSSSQPRRSSESKRYTSSSSGPKRPSKPKGTSESKRSSEEKSNCHVLGDDTFILRAAAGRPKFYDAEVPAESSKGGTDAMSPKKDHSVVCKLAHQFFQECAMKHGSSICMSAGFEEMFAHFSCDFEDAK